MPTNSDSYAGDNDDFPANRNHTKVASLASGTTAATTFGPYRLPYLGTQSADVVTAWFHSTGDIDLNVAMEAQPYKDGPWGGVGAAKDITATGGGVQSVHFPGPYMQLIVTPNSAPAAEVVVVIGARTNA